MEEMTFQEAIREALFRYDPTILMENGAEAAVCSDLYRYVEQYAVENRLRNTAISLPLVRRLAFCTNMVTESPFENAAAKLRHCLSMCRILIDLDIPLSWQETDILLSAALCHILPAGSRLHGEETKTLLEPEVFHILALIRRNESISEAKQLVYIRNVQENRLALLLRLADRGNIVEQMHSFSGWRTRRYIYETRNVYLPMCIYGKEHYPELIAPISILMEKIRSLTEVAEILLLRYETRETELMQQILELQEENARIRSAILEFSQPSPRTSL